MIQFFTKSKKPVFQTFFGPNLPKNFFFENRASSHSRVYSHAPLCQKSENFNEPISRKASNERTNGRTQVNLQDLQVGPKIRLCHVSGIANMHLCAKIQKKTNDEMPTNRFSSIFVEFSTGKNVFQKSGFVTFLPFIGKKTYVTIKIWIKKCQKSRKRVIVDILSQSKI